MNSEHSSMNELSSPSEARSGSAPLQIGLTYDLRSHYLDLGYSEEQTAEFDSPSTVEALTSALSELGYIPVQIGHLRELMRRLSDGERWDLVFNIAEGMYGLGREALIPALLDAYRIPYTFSDPCVIAVSLHKGFTKNILREAGLRTPDFTVVREEADIDSVDLPFPLFAKPLAEGTGKGIDGTSKIDNPADLRRQSLRLLQNYQQPVLVEEYLPGREFTAGILGTGLRAEVLGTLEVIIREQGEQGAYSYLNKERCEELVECQFVQGQEVRMVEELALRAWRILVCRDAGRVDIRLDAQGQPAIMEVNPLAGMHPTHSDLPMIATAVGMSYQELIERIVLSARERLEPQGSNVMLESAVNTEAVIAETFFPV